jgi:hypothetical protein
MGTKLLTTHRGVWRGCRLEETRREHLPAPGQDWLAIERDPIG